MDLARLDLKEFRLKMVRVDLRDILNAAVQSHQEDARRAGMTCEQSARCHPS